MLEGIGRIGSYAAMQKLRLEAKYKIKTGKSLSERQEELNRAMRETMAPQKKSSFSDKTRVSIIRQKLRQGRKLSADELRFLKETDDNLYEKAKKTEEAREELQRGLKRAKSREEARRCLAQAQIKVAAEAQFDAKGAACGLSMGTGGASSAAISAGNAGEEAASFAGNEVNFGSGNESNAAVSAEGCGTENSSSANKSADELPQEKYLFILAALQNEWKNFVESKEYDALPDAAGKTEDKKHSSAKKDYAQDKLLAEGIISYRKHPADFLPGDLLDVKVTEK